MRISYQGSGDAIGTGFSRPYSFRCNELRDGRKGRVNDQEPGRPGFQRSGSRVIDAVGLQRGVFKSLGWSGCGCTIGGAGFNAVALAGAAGFTPKSHT